jgi:hypothetical protein
MDLVASAGFGLVHRRLEPWREMISIRMVRAFGAESSCYNAAQQKKFCQEKS